MGATNKYQKLENFFKLYTTLATSFLLALFVTSVFFPVLPSGAVTCTNGSTGETGQVCDTASSDISVTVENPYYVTVTSSAGSGSGVTLNYTNDSGNNLGNVIAAADTVTTTSNTGRLKHLYISTTSSSSNNLISDNTDLDNNKTYIAAGGGNTLDSATALSDNTWGFALPSTTSGIPDNTFDTSYDTSALSSTSKFTKVPTLGNDILIQEEIGTENAETGEYESTATVYYGTLATTDIYAGSYSNVIRYTAFSESPLSIPTMQEFTAAECSKLPTATAENYDTARIELRDSRDNKIYTVARMKDGHCWMTANLALDPSNSRTLTPENSNVTDSWVMKTDYLVDGNGTTPSTDQSPQVITTFQNTADIYGSKYGNYYNFMAATAGAGTSTATGTISQDICPRGWHLPDNAGNKSFSNLMGSYDLPTSNTTNANAVSNVQQKPLYFPLAGRYNSSTGSQGVYGLYWSRAVYDTATYVYYLGVNANGNYFYPQDHYFNKSVANSVRCVFEGQASDMMQNFTAEMCTNLAENTQTTLVDRRNGKAYQIVHALDGNCWMADNLSIYNQTISAEDSDFDSGTYTLPPSTSWDTNLYTQPKIHVATNSGYEGQVYYNWTASVALQDGSTTAEQDQSICPKNWTLPKGGTGADDTTTNASWPKLINTYKSANGGTLTGADLTTTDTSAIAYPLGFRLYYGGWSHGGQSEGDQGVLGFFWSSKPIDYSEAYNFKYGPSVINPNNSSTRGSGRSVRCVSPIN